jgi:hypothetical protein
MKTTILFLAVPVVALWAAMAVFTQMLVWAGGWARIKRHLLALFILVGALLSLPIAGIAKLVLPYKETLADFSIFQKVDHRILMAFIPACLLWLAMVTLAYLLIVVPGWEVAKQHWLALLILAVSLLSWPAAAMAVMALSRGGQVLDVMKDHKYLAVLLPFVSLGMAVTGLTDLLFQAFGWNKLRQNRLGMTMLAIIVLSLPAAAFLKVALPRKNRVMARLHLIRAQSPNLVLPEGCSVFPANNIWNTAIRNLPVDPNSPTYIESIGSNLPIHADFSSIDGIPFSIADDSVPIVTITGVDRGSYRIPEDAPIEDGGDRHLIVVDRSACLLYELFLANKLGVREWEAETGAIQDMRSNRFSETTVDAASLPIFPGLVRYQEVTAGQIRHALRFTVRRTRRAYIWPAQHQASDSYDPKRPPMGQRFRLRASFEISAFSPQTRVILTALQEYGMFLADNGGNWFLTGAPDARWDPKIAAELRMVSGSNFEAVDISSLMVDPKSAEARTTSQPNR